MVGGWLLTALVASFSAGLAATAIFFGKGWAVLALMALVAFILWKNHGRHSRKVKQESAGSIYNLKKISDLNEAVSVTFSHISTLLGSVAESLDTALEGIFSANVYSLKGEHARAKEVRLWGNIIIANAFKSLRLLQKNEGGVKERNYLRIVRRIQKISDGYSDIVSRSYEHVANHHKGFNEDQIEDLRRFKDGFIEIMDSVQECIRNGQSMNLDEVQARKARLKKLSGELQRRQLDRIVEGASKTRLSVLFFAIIGDLYMLTNQVIQLLQILSDAFNEVELQLDMDE